MTPKTIARHQRARIGHKSRGLVINEDLGLRDLVMNNAFSNAPRSVERT